MAKKSNKKIQCFSCGKEYTDVNYYASKSVFFGDFGRVPYCKHCIEKLFNQFYDTYKTNSSEPDKLAIKRLCAAFDIFYSDEIYNHAIKHTQTKNISIFAAYMKMKQLQQWKDKDYTETIFNEENEKFIASTNDGNASNMDVEEEVINFFGIGFTEEDYKFLEKEYKDWTARHECNTKSQEEVFKRLCFTQLELLKATRNKEDTKNLNDTYLKQLDAAKLQPKQSKGDTTAETQTFGTLIDKWENTRPLPEIDEELKDVDKIGLLIHVFFTGHIAKVLGFKSTLTNLYDKYIKKYTVEKREYSSDSDNEAIFDSIFGKKNIDVDE